MDDLCHSFGELMIEWVGELATLEDGFVSSLELALAIAGESIPGDNDPRLCKGDFLGEIGGCGLPLLLRDMGAIPESASVIPEVFIWAKISVPFNQHRATFSKESLNLS